MKMIDVAKTSGRVAAIAAIVIAAGGFGRIEGQGSKARTFVSPGGTAMKVIIDSTSLGGSEVEVVELTFPANSDSGDHRHAVTETFYVLSGELEQVINGKPVKLTPGTAVSIRATDQVRHKSGPNGAKVLVIWAPGGEIDRVTARWQAK